jgi:hypothetical protein
MRKVITIIGMLVAASVAWGQTYTRPTTTVYACNVIEQGTSTGLTHSVASATGMTIATTTTIASSTITLDYTCQQ